VTIRVLRTRDAVLDAAGGHPYVRFAATMGTRLTGLATDGGLLWWGEGPLGVLGHGLGDPVVLDALLAHATAAGDVANVGWINFPRRADAPPGYVHREDWDFRWSVTPPPPQPGQDAATLVDDADAINALLDAAFPDSMLRPGHHMVVDWYGIRRGGQLVACAADRTAGSADPVGMLGAIAVHPDHRRHGYGAAVTAALTTVLRERYPVVALGVVAGNDNATRVYERLGFTGVQLLTSVRPAWPLDVRKGTLLSLSDP
jgi:GNAT superfamily N-acetyltransferase